MGESLSWLDPTNRDDQFVASTIEVIRQYPRSAVTIVTGDINLQNKAELARLPFVEAPPPPSSIAPAPARRSGPRPDIRIFELQPTGGGPESINFIAQVQNYGQQLARATVTASVGGVSVACQPSTLNLLVNTDPSWLYIAVPRPEMGDLVPAFGNENATTLYGGELLLEVSVDGALVMELRWSEHVYTEDENRDRHAIQQRVWRIGRGEDTEADRRAEYLDERLRRLDEQ